MIRARILDMLVALCVGGPVRAIVLGTALLWLGYRYLGWWTLAIIVAGAAWEFVRWPGRDQMGVTRPRLVITGGRELPRVEPRPPEPPPAPAQRPGCIPSCCGALHAGNGGHHAGNYGSEPCPFRPNRCFDHLDADDASGLSATAHQMRRSSWWYAWVDRTERHEALTAVAGEIEVRR